MTELKRSLGLTSLTFYGIGLIIGAGIYSVIGAAAGAAGESLWLSVLVAAVAALFTALSYAELASMFPKAGAEYIYARQALPGQRWASFAIGFILATAGATSAATVALSFGGYLNVFLKLPVILGAAALLLACTLVNIVGIRESSRVNILFTSIEALGLLLVIGLGVATTADFGEALLTPLHAGILPGAAIIFFVYLGFEDIANLAEEARDPGRDVPRAILISLSITTLLYMLVALAALALTTPENLAGSESPLATAVSGVSPLLARILGGIALFATANTVLIILIGASRMLFGMANNGDMPAPLKQVLPKRKSPWVAALVLLLAAGVFLPLGEVALVGSISSFGSLLAFSVVNIILLLLRFQKPDHKRPFRVPITIGRVSVPAVLGVLSTLALLFQFEPQIYLVGGGVTIIGIALYFLLRRWMSA